MSYIENDVKMDGAVLIFLPGWNWIAELNYYLSKSKVGKCNFCSLFCLYSLKRSQNGFKYEGFRFLVELGFIIFRFPDFGFKPDFMLISGIILQVKTGF